MIIKQLNSEEYKDYLIYYNYQSDYYYDVAFVASESGNTITLAKTPFETTFHKTDLNPSKLFESHWDSPQAWGAFRDDELIGVIEITPESWNNRIRVTNFWVDLNYRQKGIGRMLMDMVLMHARVNKARAIVLEVQSCNSKAISFYLNYGFSLIGLDAIAYSNNDINSKEVRLELAYLDI